MRGSQLLSAGRRPICSELANDLQAKRSYSAKRGLISVHFFKAGRMPGLPGKAERSDLKTFFKQINQIFFSSDETVCYVSLSILLIVTNQ